MIAYILKSSLSLILLFGLYWFLLRQEKLLIFNRFFLIFSILLSLIVPLISIPISIRNNEITGSLITSFTSNLTAIGTQQNTINEITNQSLAVSPPSGINFSQILLLLYISGVVLLLFRFLKNILFILYQIRLSEKIEYSGQRLALTDNQINPYCFFKTIFINKHDYLNNHIDKELLKHELEHIRESHSIDVVFIELIQIFYWFNPILILYNRAIRVNHEYLADNAVISDSADIKSYSDKLLSYIICIRNIPLTSGFNHSLTKKRLLMITKTKSNNISNGLRIIITLSSVLVFFLLLSCEPVKTHPIKVVFIPQGQFKTEKISGSDTLHNVSISVDAFYMSNEITNKEYREFTDWARKNPDETLWFPKYVPREVKDPKTGKMRNVIFKIPDIIKVSDILPSLMDSTALFKLDKKYKNYFTDKRYNDYPVVGVSMKAAEYFCIWKTFSEVIITKTDSGFITTQINHDYRLPLETEWEYVAQQPYDKQVTNFDSKVLHKSNEGNANIWDLLHFNDNVSEWVSSPEEKNGIVRGGSWQTEAGIIERSVIDPNSTEGYIGFRIVRSYSSPEQNK